jgi:hypothetical protein
MKKIFFFIFCFGLLSAAAQQKDSTSVPDMAKQLLTVEASCGQCEFGLKGKGCSLAVRMNEQAYFVDGSNIDSHGDAHADDGFCNKIRKAVVQGDVVDGRFKASYFRLLPEVTRKRSKS